MRVTVVTPPAALELTEELRTHLSLGGHQGDDMLIAAYLAAALAHLDGPDGWLGRAIGVQVLEASFYCFPDHPIRLPMPPAIEMVSVGYTDADGGDVTIDPANYRLLGGELYPAHDYRWPVARHAADAVRVRYRAGYEAMPAPIRVAIFMMVADMYAFRESASERSTAMVNVAAPVGALLAPYRVWR